VTIGDTTKPNQTNPPKKINQPKKQNWKNDKNHSILLNKINKTEKNTEATSLTDKNCNHSSIHPLRRRPAIQKPKQPCNQQSIHKYIHPSIHPSIHPRKRTKSNKSEPKHTRSDKSSKQTYTSQIKWSGRKQPIIPIYLTKSTREKIISSQPHWSSNTTNIHPYTRLRPLLSIQESKHLYNKKAIHTYIHLSIQGKEQKVSNQNRNTPNQTNHRNKHRPTK
jgi:hypothetical protein